MPPTILSSPLLSVPVLNTLLKNPDLSPVDRIPLLHAKIALLSNGPSASASASASNPTSSSAPPHPANVSSPNNPGRAGSCAAGPADEETRRMIEEMDARIEVAGLLVRLKPARLVEAENELTLVEGRLKGLFKLGRGGTVGQSTHAARGASVGLEGPGGILPELRALRIRALKDLAGVEEALGREGRARRWRELVSKLEGETA